MLTEETTEYLSVFKAFLVEQQAKTSDPRIEILLAEIDRELANRQIH
jgi:hypothetical protein